jgi:hypothetical protein
VYHSGGTAFSSSQLYSSCQKPLSIEAPLEVVEIHSPSLMDVTRRGILGDRAVIEWPATAPDTERCDLQGGVKEEWRVDSDKLVPAHTSRLNSRSKPKIVLVRLFSAKEKKSEGFVL